MEMKAISLLRVPKACEITGRGRASFYSDIKKGLMVEIVKVGPNASAVPENEIAAINAARIAGKGEDEIRELVRKLMLDRKANGGA
jgi:prophage regulatory protein